MNLNDSDAGRFPPENTGLNINRALQTPGMNVVAVFRKISVLSGGNRTIMRLPR